MNIVQVMYKVSDPAPKIILPIKNSQKTLLYIANVTISYPKLTKKETKMREFPLPMLYMRSPPNKGMIILGNA